MDELEQAAIAKLQVEIDGLAKLVSELTGQDRHKKLALSANKVRLIAENL